MTSIAVAKTPAIVGSSFDLGTWALGFIHVCIYIYIYIFIYIYYILYTCISKSKYPPIWVLAAGWVVDIGSHIVLKSHMLGNTAPQYIRINWNDRHVRETIPKPSNISGCWLITRLYDHNHCYCFFYTIHSLSAESADFPMQNIWGDVQGQDRKGEASLGSHGHGKMDMAITIHNQKIHIIFRY